MPDNLDENIRDRLLALMRGAAGVIPYGAGGFVAELVSMIPGQRVDRIVIYIRGLDERLSVLEQERRREILTRADKIDFVEEGGRQAARAISDDRIPMIVEAVVRGLTSDEADVIRRKRLLVLFGQIDDDELQLLNAYGQSYGGSDPSVWERVNRPDPAHLGSTVDQLDQEKLFDAGKETLLRLGLLRKAFPFVKRGEVPEFDASTGDFKHSVEVSYLGRMLLREIGMPSPIDQQQDPNDT